MKYQVKSSNNNFYTTVKKDFIGKKIKSFRKVLKEFRQKLKRTKKLKSKLLINQNFSKRYNNNNKYGVIHLLCNKRNIFCTLTDSVGTIKASVSTGILKVKGRKKRGHHYTPKTGQLLVNYLFKIHYRKFDLQIRGNGPKKKKRILANKFLRIKKFKFLRLNNQAPRSHNGCRPPKIRRK